MDVNTIKWITHSEGKEGKHKKTCYMASFMSYECQLIYDSTNGNNAAYLLIRLIAGSGHLLH